jgi:hypothetical protein
MLTKREVLKILKTQVAVASVLGIGKAAVCQWRDDEPIPTLRELQLRTLYPKEFGPPSEALAAFKHPLRRKTDKPQQKPPHPLRRATDKPRRTRRGCTERLHG